MRYIRIWNYKGFTLAELLVTVAVLGIITAAMAPFLGNFLRHIGSGNADATLLQEGRWAMDFINRDLNTASAVSVVISGGGTVISFSQSSAAGADVISFSLVNSEICRRSTAANPWRPLTDAGRVQASNLSFVQNSDNSYDISFTLQATDRYGQLHSRTFASRVYPMNS